MHGNECLKFVFLDLKFVLQGARSCKVICDEITNPYPFVWQQLTTLVRFLRILWCDLLLREVQNITQHFLYSTQL
jgi:hypothetical protein